MSSSQARRALEVAVSDLVAAADRHAKHRPRPPTQLEQHVRDHVHIHHVTPPKKEHHQP